MASHSVDQTPETLASHSVDHMPDTLVSPSVGHTPDTMPSPYEDHMPDILVSPSVGRTPDTMPSPYEDHMPDTMASPSVNRTRARICLSILSIIMLMILLPTHTQWSKFPSTVNQLFDMLENFRGIAPNMNITADSPASLSIPPPSKESEPDSRFNNFAFMIHSGKDVVDVRWPEQFNSFLRSVKNYILVGDANLPNVAGTGVDMIDVVHGAVEDAEARIKHGDSNNIPRLHRRRIEDTQGWKDDAHKFLPGIRILHERFPNAHWYLIGDDDVYVFVDNLHESLSSYDYKDSYYMGMPMKFKGCDGVKEFGDGPAYGHGGSGIIISQGAMKAMLKHVDQCIIKYQTCWAGDIRVALCMRDAGIYVTNPLWNQLHQDPPTLDKLRYPGDACIRPITFHHLNPDIMRLVHHSVEIARTRINSDKAYWKPASKLSHLYAPDQKHDNLPAAQTSPHYAPVHFDDVYQVFVNPYNGTPYDEKNWPLIHLGHSRDSDAHEEFTVDPNRSVLECHEKCVSDRICRAWDLDMESRRCRLIKPIPELKPKLGSVTGVILDRFVCDKHTL